VDQFETGAEVMGMGEPFDNLDEVLRAVEVLTSLRRHSCGQCR
jgi:adenine C2-methylase RlmN of 23S rRNA A2503 and tRNA A37